MTPRRNRPSAPIVALALAIVAVLGTVGWWRVHRARSATNATDVSLRTASPDRAERRVPRDFTAPAPITLSPTTVSDAGDDPHATLEGRVVSASTGDAVPNATLTFARAGASATAVSGADGAFVLSTTSLGTYELVLVIADGFTDFGAEAGRSPVVFVARPGTRVSGVVVRMTPQVEVEGVVLDPHGAPVAGAQVRSFAWSSYADSDPATTDASGHFRLRVLERAMLEATHALYRPIRRPFRASGDPNDGPAHVELRFDAERGDGGAPLTITGRVLDPSDSPIGGAVVTANPDSDDDRYILRTTTAPDGTFALREANRATYQLRAIARGFVPGRAEAVAGGATNITLRLGAGASFRGIVRDSRGAPVAGFTIVAWPRRGPMTRGTGRSWSVFNAEGRFEITGLPSGEHVVTAVAHGYGPANEANVTFPESDAAGRPIEQDFTLPRAARVSGVVLESGSRAPVAGATVRVEGALGQVEGDVAISTPVTTGPDGTFALDGVASGDRSINVTSPRHHGRILSGVRVTPDAQISGLSIELTPLREGERATTEMAGIGAGMRADGTVMRVMGVVAGGGAAEVGLQAGDAVLRIDEQRVEELGFEGSIERIRGVEGTYVRLSVQRGGGDAGVVEFNVPRRRVRF